MSEQPLNKGAIFFIAAIVSAVLCEVLQFKNLIGLVIFGVLMLIFLYYSLPDIPNKEADNSYFVLEKQK